MTKTPCQGSTDHFFGVTSAIEEYGEPRIRRPDRGNNISAQGRAQRRPGITAEKMAGE